MNFSISSSILLTHLQAVGRVINTKNILPVLDNFLIELKGNELTITASDIQTTVTSHVTLFDCEGEGAFTVTAKTLIDSLKELPEQPIWFAIDTQTLDISLRFRSGEYKFVGVSAEEYPKQKPLDRRADSFSIESDALQAGISHTLFATADDEQIPARGGIYLDIVPGDITFVVTDQYGLFLSANAAPTRLRAGFIVPRKPAGLIKGLLPKGKELVEVRFDNNAARFRFAGIELRCSLPDVRYPNYQSVIPHNYTNCLTIDRSLFLGALRRVAMFAEKDLIVNFLFTKDLLTLTAANAGFGSAAVEGVACNYTGERTTLEVAVDHLIELLLTMSCETVCVELGTPYQPLLIRPADPTDNERRLCLIMPGRVM